MSLELNLFSPQVHPFIKWAGGKQSIAQTLIDFFPKSFEKYYEPFVGGGSLFFTLSPRQAVLADENQWLIDTYLALKQDWRKVADCLEKMINTRQEFLRIRSINPWTLSLFERAAQFIYLNKTCFRGLFRVNKKGVFNAPYGAYSSASCIHCSYVDRLCISRNFCEKK
jgi:DNA adenine methylase